MKAITLKQPWASLWLHGPKLHETRAFRTHHVGWLLVHASQSLDRPSAQVGAIAARCFGGDWYEKLPRGALLGAVYLRGCEPTGMARKHVEHEDLLCGDYSPGRWAWRRIGPTIRLDEPIPLRGMPGMFDVDPALVPQLPQS
jgi:hypothetical protein